MEKQVDKSHYQFSKYVSKKRWASIWHQIQEVVSLAPENILEIGPGPGIFKQILSHLGFSVDTVDIDPELKPDFVATAAQLPFKNNSYDCVCAFQVLEHLKYDESIAAFKEMARVARKNIVISLPDSRRSLVLLLYIPKFDSLGFLIPIPQLKLPVHQFDGEHHWEINKSGYPLSRIYGDFKHKNLRLVKSYRVRENPYHRFFVYEKFDSHDEFNTET